MTTRTPAAAFDVHALRREFPALDRRVQDKRLVYLDNACTALKSRAMAERMNDFYLNWGGCGGKRSSHLMSQQVEEWMNQARSETAAFLGASSPNEIVFTSGTTEAVNLLARSFPFEGQRREVLLTDLEHNSVVLPFLEAAKRGECVLKFCPTYDGRLDLDHLDRRVTEKTALLAMTRSSNVFGGVSPAAQACRIAHRKGAKVLLDDAQFLSSHREDVAAVDADFAAFSGHKLGGPFGVGVLYGKEHLLNGLGTYKTGGATVKTVAWSDARGPTARYLDAPARLEAGVQNLAGIIGLAEALRFIKSLPEEALRGHVSSLVKRAWDGLSSFRQIRILGLREDLLEGSLISFYPAHPDFSPADFNLYLNQELDGHFIAIRVGEHCAHLAHNRMKIPASLRLSFFAYNTPEEVDLFLEALRSYIKEACR